MAKSNLGYSLMEILVVLTIVSLMGLGTTTLVTNMLNLSQKNVAKNNLLAVKEMLEKTLKSDQAWARTYCGGPDPIPAAANLLPPCVPAPAPNNIACLAEFDNIPCNEQVFNNPPIFDSRGNALYDPSVATAGFALDASACNQFGTPSDACPFRYNFTVTLDCPGTEVTCYKPDVRIQGLAALSTATPESYANRIDANEYTIEFVRNQEVRYEPFEVIHQETGNAGGGNCTAGVALTRPLDEIVYDVGNNVMGFGGGGVNLRAGKYDCEVSASAFEALDGFVISITYPSGGAVIGSGFSGIGGTAIVVGKAEVDMPVAGTLAVLHTCSGPGSERGTGFDMGIPVPNYGSGTGNIFTRVTCVRNK